MSIRRHSHRPSAALALLALLLPLLLTACDANGLFSTGTAGGATGSTQVVYWSADTTPIDVQAVDDIIAAFNKSHPDIHVKGVVVPSNGGNDLTALMTAARGGTGPDVYLLDRFTVNQQAAIGLLEDLQPFVSKEKADLSTQYLPFAWKETLFQGHPYALPLDTDARGLYYNKDLLRQAGINPAVLDPSRGPMTLDQLQRIAFRLNQTDAHGVYSRVGFLPFEDQAFHTTWGIDFGATFFDRAACQITPTEPAMVQAFAFMYDWAKDMNASKVQTYLGSYLPANAPPNQYPFYSGQLAMTLSGDWFISNIQEYAPKLNYGITYIPVVRGHTPFTWSGGFSLVIPQGAAHPAAAYRFMRFMAGPEGQRIYTRVTTHMPTWKALLTDNSLFSGRHVFLKNMLRYARSRPSLPVGAQLSDEFDTAQQKVVLNVATPLQALQTVYKRVQPQLQQYCPVM